MGICIKFHLKCCVREGERVLEILGMKFEYGMVDGVKSGKFSIDGEFMDCCGLW